MLLLILGLGAVSFLNTCNNNKRIDAAIRKLKDADSLLISAKVVLDSADKKLGRAGDDVNSAIGMLGHADNSLNKIEGINANSLKTIQTSLDKVISLDKGKKLNKEKYQHLIDSINLKIKELQKEIDHGKIQK